jgi:RHH-type proline utilization regulon transcriptional repressor/proline dehydrogenase/delta 1-pyrroline-5-carboxylate dehydrogenase
MPEFKDELEKTIRAIRSYLYYAQQEFFQERDYFHLRGQDNVFRYLPIGDVVVRIHENDTLFETLARIAAVRISGCTLTVSIPMSLVNPVTLFLNGRTGKRFLGKTPVIKESDAKLAARIPSIDRIRYAAPERIPTEIFEAAAVSGFYIASNPVLMEGRLEMLNYFREQSISHDYHRYGNLGERAAI